MTGRSGRSDDSQLLSDDGLAIPLLVTRKEAARLLSLSVRVIDYERAAGNLASVRHGKKILIPTDELRRFAESLPPDQE